MDSNYVTKLILLSTVMKTSKKFQSGQFNGLKESKKKQRRTKKNLLLRIQAKSTPKDIYLKKLKKLSTRTY